MEGACGGWEMIAIVSKLLNYLVEALFNHGFHSIYDNAVLFCRKLFGWHKNIL